MTIAADRSIGDYWILRYVRRFITVPPAVPGSKIYIEPPIKIPDYMVN